MLNILKFSASSGMATLNRYRGMMAGINLTLNSFATNGSTPVARVNCIPVTLGSIVYWLFGDTGGASTNRVLAQGTGNGTWTENTTALPYQTLGGFVTNVNGTVYIGGGFGGSTNHFSTTDFSSYTSQTSYPISGIRSCCGTPLNNKLYVSGGYSDVLGNWQRASYSYNGSSWTSETTYPFDTDTPAVWTLDGASKYYWSSGSAAYSYTGSGAYVAETAPPAGVNGLYNNTTVYNTRVYLGSGQNWYSWGGTGGWKTELTSTGWTAFGATVMGNNLYAKPYTTSTTVYKASIGA
jgi:hypothetical protein